TLAAFAVLSNEPDGRIDDGLAPDLEQVGYLGGKGSAPILLARSDASEGGIWRISPETVSELTDNVAAAEVSDTPPDNKTFTLAGAPLQDWGLLLGIAAGSFLLFWLISLGILAVMRSVGADRE